MVILIKLVQLMLSLTILVVIHELGHFSMARLFKVRVDKFYIFFNPWFSLFKFKPKNSETTWGIGWLPLGGYCKLNGMIDESIDTDHLKTEPQPYEFRSKPAWQRFIIMVAGVVFNFLLALIIYTGIAYTWGNVQLSSDKISQGMLFSPAAKAVGFQDGDVILAVNGEKMDALDNNFMRSVINAHTVDIRRGGKDTTLVIPKDMMIRVMRDQKGLLSIKMPYIVDSVLPGSAASKVGLEHNDRLIAIEGQPADNLQEAAVLLKSMKGRVTSMEFLRGADTLRLSVPLDSSGKIGIMLTPIDRIYPVERVHYSLLQAIPRGIRQGVSTMTGYVSDMKYVFTPEGADQLGGFASIGNLFPAQWNWYSFWLMTAFLSLILAVMNLLPIPALDGGHIIFLFYEMVTGKKVSEKIIINAQIVGMLLLFALMIYVNVKDIFRFL